MGAHNRRRFLRTVGAAALSAHAPRLLGRWPAAIAVTPEGPLPDWMRAPRMFVTDGHQFNTREQHIDMGEVCRTMAESFGTVLRLSAHSYMGYVYYDSQYAIKAPGLGTQDWFAEARAGCDRYGIKLIGYFNFSGYLPDTPHYGKFDGKDEKGQPLDRGEGGRYRLACLTEVRKIQ